MSARICFVDVAYQRLMMHKIKVLCYQRFKAPIKVIRKIVVEADRGVGTQAARITGRRRMRVAEIGE